MQKLSIGNRAGETLSVIIEGEGGKHLAFVMHGLGGWKDQEHIKIFADAFREQGFTVVRFDATNSYGESGGTYEDATLTNYYEDLEDVILWAKGEPWYREPFFLAGHSLGSICCVLYAEQHPKEVAGLAPISTVVSGRLSLETEKHQKYLKEWQRTGWREYESATVPGRIKRLKWTHVEDRLRYDVLPEAGKLTMPVLLIVGEHDDNTPPQHQKMLFDALPGPRELHVIKGAPHTFRAEEHLAEIKTLLSKWIQRYV